MIDVKKNGHGGKRKGSGSKPRMIAVGKTLTMTSNSAQAEPIKIVIEEIKDGIAYGVDWRGDVWTFRSEYEECIPDTEPLYISGGDLSGVLNDWDVEEFMKQLKDLIARTGTKED